MRLSEAECRRWLEHAGSNVDPYRDRQIEEILVDDHGRLRVDSTVECGIYVVLNADFDVMYVGKVDRPDGTLADRFRRHHAHDFEWHRVWVLPLNDEADPRSLELAMIKHFQPPDNIAGLPCV
ncbi:MAG: hypothetical protein JWM47_1546 [Acidimicrobiales bacterium]|nr:hypothetical protein [Acidimicrobiales bacterium]